MDKASLCAALGMGPVTELMPKPRAMAGQLFKPFVFILGGVTLCLTALCLMVGQDPTHIVSGFLAGSAETLAPFAAFLFAVWLFYVWTYVLAGASLSDVSIVGRAPDWFARLLRRLHLSLPAAGPFVCLIAPASLVRLHRPYRPVRMAMGWRAGESVQLE